MVCAHLKTRKMAKMQYWRSGMMERNHTLLVIRVARGNFVLGVCSLSELHLFPLKLGIGYAAKRHKANLWYTAVIRKTSEVETQDKYRGQTHLGHRLRTCDMDFMCLRVALQETTIMTVDYRLL